MMHISLTEQAIWLEYEQEQLRRTLDAKKAEANVVRERISFLMRSRTSACHQKVHNAVNTINSLGMGGTKDVAQSNNSGSDMAVEFAETLKLAAEACATFKYENSPLFVFLDGVDTLAFDNTFHDLSKCLRSYCVFAMCLSGSLCHFPYVSACFALLRRMPT